MAMYFNDTRRAGPERPVDGEFRLAAPATEARPGPESTQPGCRSRWPGEFDFAASGTCLVTSGRVVTAWFAPAVAPPPVSRTTDRGRNWKVDRLDPDGR